MEKFADRLDKNDHSEGLIHQAMGHVVEGWCLQFPRDLPLRDLRGRLDEGIPRLLSIVRKLSATVHAGNLKTE